MTENKAMREEVVEEGGCTVHDMEGGGLHDVAAAFSCSMAGGGEEERDVNIHM